MTINYAAERVTVTAAQLTSWHGTATREALDLTGPCPKCGHPAPNEIARRISSLESIVPAPAQALTADLTCTCTEDHPGRPDGAVGCGRGWVVVTLADSNGSVTFAPPPASPDPRLKKAREELKDAQATLLTSLRSGAEKWIGAVTALLSLFGLAGVTITRSTVAGMVTWGQVCVGIASAASVALAALAIFLIYRAAYGWPMMTAVDSDEAVMRWAQRQRASNIHFLKSGVRAAGSALALLMVTVGLLWFSPQASPPGPLVRATMTDGSQVCGTLLPSAVAAMPIVRRASDGTAVPIPVKSLVSLTAVATC